ncbi:hypothetical protein FS749_005710 [Ceratobasidium sp. UAMH 11750]|nr:hypothetical protein FS749_005710 [Ceratobasidium sp. UAMH 11750]
MQVISDQLGRPSPSQAAPVVTTPIHRMTAEVVQQMVATLQAGLKDFHDRSLSENRKILQSSLQREGLLEVQGKQLESIQELAKQPIKHAQSAVEGSKEALATAKEIEGQHPELNRTIKVVNNRWRFRDDQLTKYVKDANKGQQKRDDDLNKTIKTMNGILLDQQDKLKDIEGMVQGVKE